MTLASKVATGLIGIPHLFLVLKNREFPTLTYVVLLAISLFVIFQYTSILESCELSSSPSSLSSSQFAKVVLLPFAMTLAFMTSIVLYSLNSQGDPQEETLGVVHQYRLNDVIDRFRTIVTKRQEDLELVKV